MRGELPKLSAREEDVMSVLWKVDKPLTGLGVTEASDGLSHYTVQGVLRNLLEKGYIEVADVVYSGKTLSRSYKYVISAEEYAADQFNAMKKTAFNFSALNFVDNLIKSEDESILDELEEVLNKYKNRR